VTLEYNQTHLWSDKGANYALLDAATGMELCRFGEFGEDERITYMALSADGNLLAAIVEQVPPWLSQPALPVNAPNPPAPAPQALRPPEVRIWDISETNRAHLAPRRLSEKDLATLWEELGRSDAARAHWAMRTLAATPASAVPFLCSRLRPVTDAKSVPDLIGQLDSPQFDVRDRASRQLEALRDVAEPALRAALKQHPSMEVRRRIEQILAKLGNALTGDELRALRSMDVLEVIGGPPAEQALDAVARGAPGSCVTQAAKEGLARLRSRAGAR
jgi:hypothetical protein